MTMKPEIHGQGYKGWSIFRTLNNPPTGRFVGYLKGTSVCGNTIDLVKSLIDQRIEQFPESNGA